ncbi:MAG: DUF4340 domain-containing protein [Cyclobacteriaceae bacterium]
MKKSTRLSIILIVLIAMSVFISFLGKRDTPSTSFDADMFAVEDTTAIASVRVSAPGHEVELKRNENGWSLNDEYKADPNMVQVLRSILSQVKVQRPVARLNRDEIVSTLEQTGYKVSVSFQDGSVSEFIAGGDNSKKMAFYLRDNDAYVVQIPGYNHYLSGIFELTPNQWRDRLLFSSTWRSLKSLKLDYANQQETLNIYFDKKFLTVENVAKLDTTALMDYLGQYQYFQVNDYLEKGKYPKYDDLARQSPLAHLSIRDIDQNRDADLNIYPLMDGEAFYLITDSKGEMMVIDSSRMDKLLSKKDQFISE